MRQRTPGRKSDKIASAAFEESVKTASKAGVTMARDIGVESTKVFVNGGLEAAKIAADTGLEVSKIAADGVVKSSERVGLAATQELAPYVGAAVCIYALKEVATIGSDLYEYNYPGEEKKAKINEAREKNEFYDAKRNFRSCLINNSKAQRNNSGLPVACEDLGRMFTMMAGRGALDDMTETFKAAYQE